MTGFLPSFISGFVEALYPLYAACKDPFHFQRLIHDLGWVEQITEETLEQLDFVPTAIGLIEQAQDLVEQFTGSGSNLGEKVEQAVLLVEDTLALIDELRDSPPNSASLPPLLRDEQFWTAFALDLPEYLFLRWLQTKIPIAYTLLHGLDIIEETVQNGQGNRGPYTRRAIRWNNLAQLPAGPVDYIKGVYRWNQSGGFRHEKLLAALNTLFRHAGIAALQKPIRPDLIGPDGIYSEGSALAGSVNELDLPIFAGRNQQAGYSEIGLLLAPAASQPDGPAASGLVITNLGWGDPLNAFQLSETWTLSTEGTLNTTRATGVNLQPGDTRYLGQNTKPDAEIILKGRPITPWRIMNADGSSLAEIEGMDIALKFTGSTAEPEIILNLNFTGEGIKIAIDPAQGDSFLSGAMGSAFTVNANPALLWSSKTGMALAGSSGLETTIPLNLKISALTLHYLHIALTGIEKGVQLQADVAAAFDLGILSCVVEGVGFIFKVQSSDQAGDGAAFGSISPALAFKPPDGFGLSIDEGPVSGGGFLYIDADAGSYAGILDLDLLSIGISAIGLVDTRLPGGGWSMFLALFIDLPSIPLGFGFTLNGVGGVAGINRTLDVDALSCAIRSGALDDVLFPEDPVADAPVIIDAFQNIFPSAEGRFVFGPVIKIGWGSPTLIEAELGVVVSLPDPITIALLGSVTSILPTEDTDLVALHLDVAGVIDMGAATLSIDSSLHGSHIAGFPLSGDMALRTAFGDNPTFLMALGGSHPGFDRPSGFPRIDRLSLAINAGSLIDIRFACYFAISANSLQFGAEFELTAEVEGFGINGGASFDALVTYSPFSLRTGLGFHISVKAVGVDLMAVWLDVTLSGPNPWYIQGTATFTILKIDNTIQLDEKIGSKKAEELPEDVDVLSQLRTALAQEEAWSVESGGGKNVTLSAQEPQPGKLVVAPDGLLGVSQRVIPLDITIDKAVPWQIKDGYNRFDLKEGENGIESSGTLTEWFAVSSYMDLAPRERLSAPSFEQQKAGITFGGKSTAGAPRKGTLDYEQILRDPELKEEAQKLQDFNIRTDLKAEKLAGMATAATQTGYTIAKENNPIQVHSAGYAVANRDTGNVIRRESSWMAGQNISRLRKNATVVPEWEIIA